MRLLYFLFAFLLGCNSNTENIKKIPSTFEAKVVGIKDGDTFEVLYHDKSIIIRLEHIDCPEKKQPFGKNAKQFASDLCYGKIVTIKTNGKFDRYKRLIAEIYINEMCINKELVRNGFAWHFRKYSTDSDYHDLEQAARLNLVGLWIDNDPIAPWDWRSK